jgi:uncharacterized protein DUF2442
MVAPRSAQRYGDLGSEPSGRIGIELGAGGRQTADEEDSVSMTGVEQQLRRIRSISYRPPYRLTIAWDEGVSIAVDFSDLVGTGVFAPLKDTEIFSTAHVGERGRWIEWPDPARPGDEPLVEIDADALYEMGMSQRARSTLQQLLRRLSALTKRDTRRP